MLTARKNKEVVDAYARLGSYRAAGEVCGVDPKTVKRKVLAHHAGLLDDERAARAAVPRNTDRVCERSGGDGAASGGSCASGEVIIPFADGYAIPGPADLFATATVDEPHHTYPA